MKSSHENVYCTSSFKAPERNIDLPSHPRPLIELTGKLVNRQGPLPSSQDYCDKHYERRPNSAMKITNSARTLIPDLQEKQMQKPVPHTPSIDGFSSLISHTDLGYKITKCERKHNELNYASNVFNYNSETSKPKPVVAKILPVDRNVSMIGNRGSACLKDRAIEPCITSPSQNMKNFRDFRSSIIGMPGSSTSRQPMCKDINCFNAPNNNPVARMVNTSYQDKPINVMKTMDVPSSKNDSKQGKKKFMVKDTLLYGTIEKEEKKPSECGKRGNKGQYNVFKSHIESFA
jgi:hypothetical protein